MSLIISVPAPTTMRGSVADLEGGFRGSEPPLSSGNNTDLLARIARLIGYIWLMEHTNHL